MNALNIGLTGGIACGKSTVAAMLTELGAVLVDADRIAREVVEPGMPALGAIAERFGPSVLLENGALNRRRLGDLVFADPVERKALEAILHPPIRARMKELMQDAEMREPHRLVVVDVPLLYESNLAALFSAVMVVYIPAPLQIERLMARDKLSRDQAEARIRSQMPIEEKRRKADFVIDNSGSPEETKAQIDRFWRERGLQ